MPWRRLTITDAEASQLRKDYPRRSRFVVDESLGVMVALLLRELGHNVKDVSEVELRGRSDEDVYAFAFKDKRILLTHDQDFLDDARFPWHRNPGVVILPGGQGEEHLLLRALRLTMTVVAPFGDLWKDSKIFWSGDNTMSVINHDSSGRLVKHIYRFDKHGRPSEWVEKPSQRVD